MSARQQAWAVAAVEADRAGSEVAALLFTLIAQPSAQERRGHSCVEHAQGFRRDGRRGFKCGICREVVKWVDP
jgi:hypothetical protein